jgi:hypothetical protein
MESRRFLKTNNMQQLVSGKLSDYMLELYVFTLQLFSHFDVVDFQDLVAGLLFCL